MLDDGSTITLTDAKIAKEIKAMGPRHAITLLGVGDNKVEDDTSGSVTVEIRPVKSEGNFKIQRVRTIANLALPRQILHRQELEKYPHLRKLPIHAYENVSPALLLGQDNWDLALPLEIRRAKRQEPVAIRTALGWVVHGFMPHLSLKSRNFIFQVAEKKDKTNYLENSDTAQLCELIKNNFQLESLGISHQSRKNALEERAEQLLRDNSVRVGGRWQTCLLWKALDVELPNNYYSAFNRLKNLEKNWIKIRS